MNGGTIWWGQVGNSLQLLSEVTNALRDGRSAVLQLPSRLPWRQDFYEAVDFRRSAFGGVKRMMRLDWNPGEEPGEFVLDELCSNRVKADYWPGQTYAPYLGSREDILLNDYYVWVCGIHSKADMAKWIDFVTQYDQASQTLESRAVFVLEYDGGQLEVNGMHSIAYTVENYDCRVFCLETVASQRSTAVREYQAELALHLGDGDPELCGALLDAGEQLLQNPVKTAQGILSQACNAQGQPFGRQSEQQLTSAAWKAAIVLLFPVLEEYRLAFISRYEHALARHLPISNSNGDRVTDPYDLEIGAIQYITGSSPHDFPGFDSEAVRLCRKARNLLAHNKPVPYEDARRILAL